MNNIISKKMTTYKIVYILMSLYCSLLESIIPKPFPWMRIGLASIIIILAIKKFGFIFAMEVLVLRIIVSSIMLGRLFSPTFFISLSAGIVSICVMNIMFKYKNNFSIVAVSGCGGFCHNLTQSVVVYFLLFSNIPLLSKGVLFFLLFFLIFGFFSGIIIGVVSTKFLYKN